MARDNVFAYSKIECVERRKCVAYLYTRYLKAKTGECESCRLAAKEEAIPQKVVSGREDYLIRDQEYFRNLYPLRIRRMKDYIREEIEQLGNESFLNDEYPDRVRMDRARDRIIRKMEQDSVEEVKRYDAFGRDVVETLLYQEIIAWRSLRY